MYREPVLHTLLPAEPAVAFMSSAMLTEDHPSWVRRVSTPSQKEVAERVTGLSLEDSHIPPNQLCVIPPSLYTCTPCQGLGEGLKYLGWEELGEGAPLAQAGGGGHHSLWVLTS